ncbi:MAG: Rieske (2Fe-2S) protein [Opitutaceae bacterium]|nr:Rieske (2Fe-2S) protein [Opitutaceae bacterium]
MSWQLFGPLDDIVEGKFTLITFGKRTIGVTRLRGALHAVLNHCPHAGAPVCAGHIHGYVTSDGPGQSGYDADRKILRCPWHHWEFDLVTGSGSCDGTGRIKTYPVKEIDGAVWVDF